MKCANCGREFGDGVNCQNCGIDRVTGLANYGGYENPEENYSHNSSDRDRYAPPKNTVCYSCGEIIPTDSQFCPICGKELWVECPNCGNDYSSQYSICNHCGTNREQFLKEQRKREAEREAYLKKRQEEERKREAKETPTYIIVMRIIGLLILIGTNYSDTENLIMGLLVGIPLLFSSEKWLDAL